MPVLQWISSHRIRPGRPFLGEDLSPANTRSHAVGSPTFWLARPPWSSGFQRLVTTWNHLVGLPLCRVEPHHILMLARCMGVGLLN
jgi:hypothetical protein